jgi:hypothetical protein
VENEVKMTNEELELALKEVNGKLAQYGPDNKISGKEWRRKMKLQREHSLLENIKKAKEKGNATQEARNLMQYHLHKEDAKMNPVIRYIMQLKMRSQIWM